MLRNIIKMLAVFARGLFAQANARRARMLRPDLEPLPRLLEMSVDLFTNLAGGNWTTASNWSDDVPTPSSDVDISGLSAGAVVTLPVSGTGTTVNSLTLDGTLSDADTLTASNGITTTEGTGLLNLSGTLKNTMVAAGVTLQGNGGTLDGDTIDSELNISGNSAVNVLNGLTLNSSIVLGTSTTTGSLHFEGSQTLAGNGQVIFTRLTKSSSYDILDAVPLAPSKAAPTLTIDQGITILASPGSVGIMGSSAQVIAGKPDNFVDNGTMTASGAGLEVLGNLTIGSTGSLYYGFLAGAPTLAGGSVSGTLTNDGTLSIDTLSILYAGSYRQASTANLNMTFRQPQPGPTIAPLTVTGSTQLAGTLTAFIVSGYTPPANTPLEVVKGGIAGTKFGSVVNGTASYSGSGTNSYVYVNPIAPPLPDITVTSAQLANVALLTTPHGNLNYNYKVTGSSPSFLVSLYQEASPSYSPLDTPVATHIITPGSSGTGSDSFSLTGITLDPSRPYLVVAADPLNLIPESNETNNTAAINWPYTPSQIRAAYGLPSLSNLSTNWSGAGQTIAIIGLDDVPTLQSDLNHFDSTFGLPNITVTKDELNNPPTGTFDEQTETTMDVEWAHAIAPGAKIVLVEAPADGALSSFPNYFNSLAVAANYSGVSVVSTSFIEPLDFQIKPHDASIFMQSNFNTWITTDHYDTTIFNHAGVTFLAATNDWGGGLNTDSYPAISPSVVAVGGTTLSINANSYSESGWSGTGGTASTYESEPFYQEGVQNTDARTIPDVASDADPASGVYIYSTANGSSNPWYLGLGTSLSAPCWAALMAIVDDQRANVYHLPPLTGATQTLPALYDMPHADFNSISTINNGSSTTGLLNPALYNENTGLGSPKAVSLVPALAAWLPLTIIGGALPVGTTDTPYSMTYIATGGSGTSKFVITPGWSAYPQGLTFDVTQNNKLIISGTPTLAGSYPFTATVTDSNGFTAQQSFVLTISPKDVTSQLQRTESGLVYNRSTQIFGGTMTLANTGMEALTGTLMVELTGLTPDVTLANASGYTADGIPYILVNLGSSGLAAGQSITFTLLFSDPKLLLLQYGATIYDD
jgi:hypothetical protein